MTVKVITRKADFQTKKIECHYCKSVLEFGKNDVTRSKASPKRRQITCPVCDTKIDVKAANKHTKKTKKK